MVAALRAPSANCPEKESFASWSPMLNRPSWMQPLQAPLRERERKREKEREKTGGREELQGLCAFIKQKTGRSEWIYSPWDEKEGLLAPCVYVCRKFSLTLMPALFCNVHDGNPYNDEDDDEERRRRTRRQIAATRCHMALLFFSLSLSLLAADMPCRSRRDWWWWCASAYLYKTRAYLLLLTSFRLSFELCIHMGSMALVGQRLFNCNQKNKTIRYFMKFWCLIHF